MSVLQLVRYLDEFVVGQENAKKVLSVACVHVMYYGLSILKAIV